MAEGAVRPTKRCLDQLGLQPPTVDVPLHTLSAEPIEYAQSIPERFEAGGAKRIRSLRDRVWFKVKTSRWRGAVTRLTDADLAADLIGRVLSRVPVSANQ